MAAATRSRTAVAALREFGWARRCLAPAPLALALALAPHVVYGQEPTHPSPHRITVHAEAIAVGATYVFAPAQRWALGVSASVGRHMGVTLDDTSDLDTWAAVYATVEIRPAPRVALLLEPAGAAVVVGNDFGTVYPSAAAELRVGGGRLRVGSRLRAVRIAGGNGSGIYWVQWVPLRVGLALGG